MLSKVICPLFNHGEISFNSGLNIILGDDDARNSIGKSSALMVIDFVMGGMSLLEDKAGVIKSLGHHTYNIEFFFNSERYFFRRSTDASDRVQICNKDFDATDEISVSEYTAKLKILYELEHLSSSFRSLISPFSRIWNKGALDPDQPFVGDFKESTGSAIGRLIDIFGRTGEILEEKSALDSHAERKKLISRSMNSEIIPKINNTQYKSNLKRIADNTVVIESLKQGFAGALSAYEALFDERLRALHQQKNVLVKHRNEVLSKIDRINRDLLGVTPRLIANISLVTEFFPQINVERLKQVEAFHQNIGKMVQKELRKELALQSKHELDLRSEINGLENNIRDSLADKGTPGDLCNDPPNSAQLSR